VKKNGGDTDKKKRGRRYPHAVSARDERPKKTCRSVSGAKLENSTRGFSDEGFPLEDGGFPVAASRGLQTKTKPEKQVQMWRKKLFGPIDPFQPGGDFEEQGASRKRLGGRPAAGKQTRRQDSTGSNEGARRRREQVLTRREGWGPNVAETTGQSWRNSELSHSRAARCTQGIG